MANLTNQPTKNWGTATAANLAIAVSDKCDLAHGQPVADANGKVAADAVQRYKDGKTKDLIRDAGSSDVYPRSGE